MIALRERVKNQYEIRDVLYELKNNFYDNFDKPWFYVVIDDLPVDLKNINSIKEAFAESLLYNNLRELMQIIIKIEWFVQNVKKYLLPVIKEKLRVSHLYPDRLVRDKNLYIKRNLLAYVLPINLQNLDELNVKLKNIVLDSLSG
jgi:hypothetical protein